MYYLKFFFRTIFSLLIGISFPSCATEALEKYGNREEQATAIHAAYTQRADFLVIYSKGEITANKAVKDQKKAVAHVSREALMNAGEFLKLKPGGHMEHASPIPVVNVRKIFRAGKVSSKDAVLVEKVTETDKLPYFEIAIQFVTSNGEVKIRKVGLPIKGEYIMSGVEQIRTAALILDITTLPVQMLGALIIP